MGKAYVCNGAKIECKLCTKPEGQLLVTSNQIKVQDKLFANANDKEKTNLIFQGNCKKSPFMAVPCIAAIQTGPWQNTSDTIIQDAPALTEASTIMCMYGGVPIKITDHLQVNAPIQLMPVMAPVIAVSTPQVVTVVTKSNTTNTASKTVEEQTETCM